MKALKIIVLSTTRIQTCKWNLDLGVIISMANENMLTILFSHSILARGGPARLKGSVPLDSALVPLQSIH